MTSTIRSGLYHHIGRSSRTPSSLLRPILVLRKLRGVRMGGGWLGLAITGCYACFIATKASYDLEILLSRRYAVLQGSTQQCLYVQFLHSRLDESRIVRSLFLFLHPST